MLLEFLCEIFDVLVDQSIVSLYVDLKTAEIKYTRIYESAELRRSLMFHFVWRAFWKRAATKLDFWLYQQSSWGQNPHRMQAEEAEHMIKYVKSATFMQFVQFAPAMIQALQTDAMRYFGQLKAMPTFVEREIVDKLFDRFGLLLSKDRFDTGATVFKVYKSLVQAVSTSDIISEVRSALNMGSSANVTAASTFYAASHAIIREKVLFRRNPLTCSLQPLTAALVPDEVIRDDNKSCCFCVSIGEAMRFITAADGYYVRSHIVSDCLVVCDDVQTAHVGDIANAINANAAQQVTVFCTSVDVEDSVKEVMAHSDTYVKVIRTCPCILANLPRIHPSCFVLVGNLISSSNLAIGLAKDLSKNILLTVGSFKGLPTMTGAALASHHFDRVLWLSTDADDAALLPTTLCEKPSTLAIYKAYVGQAHGLSAAPPLLDHVIKTHMRLSCPLRMPQMQVNNHLYALHAVLACAEKAFPSLLRPGHGGGLTFDAKRAAKNAIVIVDTRMNAMSVLSCMLAVCNMAEVIRKRPDDWCLLVLTHKGAFDAYRDAFPKAWNVRIETMPGVRAKKFTIEDYNTLLKSAAFWSLLHDVHKLGHCMLVQDDGLLLRPLSEDAWRRYSEQYTYVGAPWDRHAAYNKAMSPYVNAEFVGNGGFTIRDVADMLRVCREHAHEATDLYHVPTMTMPEDVFFSKRARRVCPFDQACSFAMEEVFNLEAYGVHKFWSYHPIAKVQSFFSHLHQS